MGLAPGLKSRRRPGLLVLLIRECRKEGKGDLDEAIERAQCVSEAGGFAGDSGVISRGFGGIRGDSGEVLKHWAVDAQPKARENNRNGPIPMCFPSAAAGGTWPLYNTRKEGEAAWDLEGVLSTAVSRNLWTRIEGKAFLVVCW